MEIQLKNVPVGEVFRDSDEARYRVVAQGERDTTFETLDDPRPSVMQLRNTNIVKTLDVEVTDV